MPNHPQVQDDNPKLPLRRFWQVRGTVEEMFTGRDNSLGVLRLLMASGVIVSHAGPMAFGTVSLLNRSWHGQTNVGNLAVYGFFVLSGILVTRSGTRLGVGRFLWHRALRLLPGLWVCLLATALVVAPFLYHRLHGGSLAGFGHGPAGPLDYVRNNLLAGEYQTDVSGVTDAGAKVGLIPVTGLNGSLWSLKYEMLCYLAVALLGWSGVLRRARRVVVLVATWLAFLVLGDALGTRFLDPRSVPRPWVPFPQFGLVSSSYLIYLAAAFAMGALIELYRHRVRINDLWGVLCACTVVGTLWYGYFFVVGLPAFAYLMVWLAIRLPKPLRRIGARHDYSYGLYIYGWPVMQVLVILGAARWGQLGFRVLALGLSLLCAALSWHLVERPALRLKDVRIPLGRFRDPRPPTGGEPTPTPQHAPRPRPHHGTVAGAGSR